MRSHLPLKHFEVYGNDWVALVGGEPLKEIVGNNDLPVGLGFGNVGGDGDAACFQVDEFLFPLRQLFEFTLGTYSGEVGKDEEFHEFSTLIAH